MSVQQVGSPATTRFQFGPFELNVAERSLRKGSQVVPLGGRAYDILIALLDNAGGVVGKAELIARAWPDIPVDEGSLRFHLSALRKALGESQTGDKYIANIQGRGYRFMAPVTRLPADHVSGHASAATSNLPPALGRMVGRNDVVLEVQGWLQAKQRMITVLGTGGIGKTTVAVSVGRGALADFSGAAFFVDLSTLNDEEHLIGAIASAVGLNSQLADPKQALVNFLRSRRALIILDSCEHLIEKTAEVAEHILQNTPDICMLATSREALNVSDERVLRLNPLDCPPEAPGMTASEVLAYPAARLFVERVSAQGYNFSHGYDEAPFVAEICRRLDGIALAIELAAGRAAIFGVRDTLTKLESRLDLLKFGRRTANPRHQTLRATLDWSHDYLTAVERAVLRRLAIFAGNFTLEGALEIAEETGTGQSEIEDAVGNLVKKSLIGTSSNARETLYRLLDTTRSYALEKLVASGEHHSIAERHANVSIQLLESNNVNIFDLRAAEGSVDRLRDYLGNVRAALEWSFGLNGNDDTAIRLAAAASQLLLAMSLLSECRKWMERAIDRMAEGCDPRRRMQVHAALAFSLMYTEGNSERVREAFHTALSYAQRHEDTHLHLCLLSGMSMYLHGIDDIPAAYELAVRAEAAASKAGSTDDAAIADSMMGAACHLRLEHSRAQEYLKRSLHGVPRLRRFNASQYLFDLRSSSLIVLTHSLFFTGNLEQAAHHARMNIEIAIRSGHPIGLCRALIHPMRLYFWVDDLEQIERDLSTLEHTAESHSLAPLRALALGLRGRYLIRVGRVADGVQHLRESLGKLAIHRYAILKGDILFELVVALAKQNERAEALALVDQWIAADGKANKPLHLPFLAKGLAFSSGEVPDGPFAEEFLTKAMIQARQESALPFELRAGLELARIWTGRGETQRTHDLISPIYGQFSEGLTTPDLVLAKQFL